MVDASPDMRELTPSWRVRLTNIFTARATFGVRFGELLTDGARADAARLSLWAPVGIGAGAVLYFMSKTEPHPFAGSALLLISFLLWRFAGRHAIAAALVFVALGFAAADFRQARVDAPIIERETRFVTVTGVLDEVDEGDSGRRLVIAVRSISGFSDAALPERVRLTWRGKDFAAAPGDIISLRGKLSPPPSPVAPGSFDFARQLYFERIGGVGFAVSPPEVIEQSQDALAIRIEQARLALARRITTAAPGQGGAIVAAVITGKRGAVTEESRDALRDSGLAHLLAISGLHMGIATGLIFFAVRQALAFHPRWATVYPIKKWAAACALLSGFGYLLLSGGGWSATRAFIMTAIIFIAILLDRRALSLRNVAVAATLILLFAPEAVLHPGFQMSFAAVTALIAAYEWSAGRFKPLVAPGLLGRVRRYAVGVAVTDTIAAVATAPYSLYHFHRAAIYSLPANLAAMPLMAFWIMPAALVAILLMPIGLDGWAWRLSAYGVELVLYVGAGVAQMPGSVATIAHPPPVALGLVTLGGLWFCLMTSRWRFFGLLGIPAAMAFHVITDHPEIYVNRDGDNAGLIILSEAGPELALFKPRKDRFASGAWLEFSGFDELTARPSALTTRALCDADGCVAQIGERRIAVSTRAASLADDCQRADLVIALFPAPRAWRDACAAKLIDRRDAWNCGAHSVMLKPDRILVSSVAASRGQRPWTHESCAK